MKTIFIIVISVVVTVILMNNTDEISFWIFGDARVPKLAILGTMFGLGLIVGFLAGRPKPKAQVSQDELVVQEKVQTSISEKSTLSDEDRDYIR